MSSPSPSPLTPAPTRSPPCHADAFALFTSSPPPPSPTDPRVSLRPLPPPEDPPATSEEPQTLSAFHASEGPVQRLSRLRSLFESIPAPPPSPTASTSALPAEEGEKEEEERRREENRRVYAKELWGKCSGNALCLAEGKAAAAEAKAVRWSAFEKYAEEKEKELWRLFVELDVDGDMRLRKEEVREACKRAGVEIKERTLDDFIRAVDKNGDGAISFDEWRDFLLVRLSCSLWRGRRELMVLYANSCCQDEPRWSRSSSTTRRTGSTDLQCRSSLKTAMVRLSSLDAPPPAR